MFYADYYLLTIVIGKSILCHTGNEMERMSKVEIGEIIKYFRDMNDIGVNELARISEVPASYISKLERGSSNNPSFAIVNKLIKALGLTDDEIAFIMQSLDRDMPVEQLYVELKERGRMAYLDVEQGIDFQSLCFDPVRRILYRYARDLTKEDYMLISSSVEHLVQHLANRNKSESRKDD
jgi:transcriptional regulator with XRE-family HTH domain